MMSTFGFVPFLMFTGVHAKQNMLCSVSGEQNKTCSAWSAACPSMPQAAARLVAAGRLHGHQAPLSAGAKAGRLYCAYSEHSGPISAGPLQRARDHPV